MRAEASAAAVATRSGGGGEAARSVARPATRPRADDGGRPPAGRTADRDPFVADLADLAAESTGPAGPDTGRRNPVTRPVSLEDEHWLDEPPPGPVPERPGPRWAARLSNRFLIGAAVLSLLFVGAVALVLRVAQREDVPPPAAPHAPTAVTIRLTGTTATVTWTDPTHATVPFIVSGGVAGQASRIRQPVPAGQTSLAITNLNAKLDYCFTVVAVYGPNTVAVSDLACAHRPK
jgi:hypothetical protein